MAIIRSSSGTTVTGSDSGSGSSQVIKPPSISQPKSNVSSSSTGSSSSKSDNDNDKVVKQSQPIYNPNKGTVQIGSSVYQNVKGITQDASGNVKDVLISQDGKTYTVSAAGLKAGSVSPSAIQSKEGYFDVTTQSGFNLKTGKALAPSDTGVLASLGLQSKPKEVRATERPLAQPLPVENIAQLTGGAQFIQQNRQGEYIRAKEYENLSPQQRAAIESQVSKSGYIFESGKYIPKEQTKQEGFFGYTFGGGQSRQMAEAPLLFSTPSTAKPMVFQSREVQPVQRQEQLSPLAKVLYGQASREIGGTSANLLDTVDVKGITTPSGIQAYNQARVAASGERFVAGLESGGILEQVAGFGARSVLGVGELVGGLRGLQLGAQSVFESRILGKKTPEEAKLTVVNLGFSTSGALASQQVAQNVGLFEVAAGAEIASPLARYAFAGGLTGLLSSTAAEAANSAEGKGFNLGRVAQSTATGVVLGGVGGAVAEKVAPLIGKGISKLAPVEYKVNAPIQIATEVEPGVFRIKTSSTGTAKSLLGETKFSLSGTGEAITGESGSTFISGTQTTKLGKAPAIVTPVESVVTRVGGEGELTKVATTSRAGKQFTIGSGSIEDFTPKTDVGYVVGRQGSVRQVPLGTSGTGQTLLFETPKGSFFKDVSSGYKFDVTNRPINTGEALLSEKAGIFGLDVVGGETNVRGSLTKRFVNEPGLLGRQEIGLEFSLDRPLQTPIVEGKPVSSSGRIIYPSSAPGEGSLVARGRVFRPIEEAFSPLQDIKEQAKLGVMKTPFGKARITELPGNNAAISISESNNVLRISEGNIESNLAGSFYPEKTIKGVEFTNPELFQKPKGIKSLIETPGDFIRETPSDISRRGIQQARATGDLQLALTEQRQLSAFTLSTQEVEKSVRSTIAQRGSTVARTVSSPLVAITTARPVSLTETVSESAQRTIPRSEQRISFPSIRGLQPPLSSERTSLRNNFLVTQAPTITTKQEQRVLNTPIPQISLRTTEITPVSTQRSFDISIPKESIIPKSAVKSISESPSVVSPPPPPSVPSTPGIGASLFFGGSVSAGFPGVPNLGAGSSTGQTGGGKGSAKLGVFDLLTIATGRSFKPRSTGIASVKITTKETKKKESKPKKVSLRSNNLLRRR